MWGRQPGFALHGLAPKALIQAGRSGYIETVSVLRRLCVIVTVAVAATSCGSSPPEPRPTGQPAASPPTEFAPTTSAPPTTLPVITVAEGGLGSGDRGDQVRILEERLDGLHYDVGSVDGVFDEGTTYGVTAFQHVNGLSPSGRATQDVIDRLSSAQPPSPLVPAGGARRVEISLPQQVLFLYDGGGLSRILPVSTGSGARYCSTEGCGTAVTPPGTYRVDYHAEGWVRSPLGELYRPVYFDPKNGLAIHGSPDVPAEPASHGCVRIPMSAAEWFPDKAPKGTPVYVSDGQTPLEPTPT